MKHIAVILPNYNMHERAWALHDRLISISATSSLFVINIDNGSNIRDRAREDMTTVRLMTNIQTTGAWLMGLHYADALERKFGFKFFAYCMMITSAEFVAECADPITPLVQFLEKNPNAVGVHPALTKDSTTSWEHLKAQDKGFRPVWMIDNICAMWRADWFNSIGRFDPRLFYGWGSDLETCYKARKEDRGLYVCDDVKVKKVTDIGYTMNRMGMSAEERKELARKNMDEVFTEKYGPDWRDLMYSEY